jgi:hypothetical protein
MSSAVLLVPELTNCCTDVLLLPLLLLVRAAVTLSAIHFLTAAACVTAAQAAGLAEKAKSMPWKGEQKCVRNSRLLLLLLHGLVCFKMRGTAPAMSYECVAQHRHCQLQEGNGRGGGRGGQAQPV